MELMSIVIVFFLGMAIDISWACYIKAVARNDKFIAALFSVAVVLPGLFSILEILENKLLMVPYCLGLFCGTLLVLSLKDD